MRALARAAVGRHVARFDAQSAAIVIAILIGDRVGLDDEVQRRLQEAGTYHVIAISGGNIAILAGLMLWLLRLAGVGHRASSWMTIVVLIGYAAVVGGGASVVRATVMAVIYLVARQAGHRSTPVNALAVTCAVAPAGDAGRDRRRGVLADLRRHARHPGRRRPGGARGSRTRAWLRAPAALLLTSLCAELALLPVAALAFSRVTFAGLVLNFVAIPMMSVAQIAGMVTVPLALRCGRARRTPAASSRTSAPGASCGAPRSWTWFRGCRTACRRRTGWPMAGYYAGWAAWLWAARPGGSGGWRPASARRSREWSASARSSRAASGCSSSRSACWRLACAAACG